MMSDFEIGRVVAVDTAQVTIELTADLRALMRTTYEGAQEVGRIDSYVVMPVGTRRLVNRVMLVDEVELNSDRTMVTLPIARRLMKATLIGTIDDDSCSQGVALFPILDNTVHLATTQDLNTIFDFRKEDTVAKPKDPGYCIKLGESPIFEGFPIHIDPDAFFGKHAAILGSTGPANRAQLRACFNQSWSTRKQNKCMSSFWTPMGKAACSCTKMRRNLHQTSTNVSGSSGGGRALRSRCNSLFGHGKFCEATIRANHKFGENPNVGSINVFRSSKMDCNLSREVARILGTT
jgi:hypothetical protein